MERMKTRLKRVFLFLLSALMLFTSLPLSVFAKVDYDNLTDNKSEIVNKLTPVKPAKPAENQTAKDLIENPKQPAIYTLRTDYKVQRGEKYQVDYQPYIASVGEVATADEQKKVDKLIKLPDLAGYEKPDDNYKITYDKVKDAGNNGSQEFRYKSKTNAIKIKHVFQDLHDFTKYTNPDGSVGEEGQLITTQNGNTGSTMEVSPLGDKHPNRKGFVPEAPFITMQVPENAENFILEYRYNRAHYDVKFDTKDGTPVPNRTLYYEQIIPTIEDKSIPTKAGCDFLGWMPSITLETTGGITYPENQIIKDSNDEPILNLAADLKMPASEITFTAVWKDKPKAEYVIQFWTEKADYDDKDNTLPLRERYDFIGARRVDNADTGSTPNLTDLDIHGITFPDLNGGRLEKAQADKKEFARYYFLNEELTRKQNASKENPSVQKSVLSTGETVYNVYYNRRVYTLYFTSINDYNDPWAYWPIITRDGKILGKEGDPYKVNVRFNQSLDKIWPKDEEVSGLPKGDTSEPTGDDGLIGWTINNNVPFLIFRDTPPYRLSAEDFIDSEDVLGTGDYQGHGHADKIPIGKNKEKDRGEYEISLGASYIDTAIAYHIDIIKDDFEGKEQIDYDMTYWKSDTNTYDYEFILPHLQGFTLKKETRPAILIGNEKVGDVDKTFDELNAERNAKTPFRSDADKIEYISHFPWSQKLFDGTNAYDYANYYRNKYKLKLNNDPKTVKNDSEYGEGNILDVSYELPLNDLKLDTKHKPQKPNWVRDDWSFLGWALDPAGDNLVKDGKETKLHYDQVLYAKWGEPDYKWKVIFDPNGGSLRSIDENNLTTKRKTVKEGDIGQEKETTYPIKEKSEGDKQVFKVFHKQKLVEPSFKPVRKGYDFMGWEIIRYKKDATTGDYTDVIDTSYRDTYKVPELYSFGNDVVSPIYLKAIWVPNARVDVKVLHYYLDKDYNLDKSISPNPDSDTLENKRADYLVATTGDRQDDKYTLAPHDELEAHNDKDFYEIYKEYNKRAGLNNSYFQTFRVEPEKIDDGNGNLIDNPNFINNVFKFFYRPYRHREYKVNYIDESFKGKENEKAGAIIDQELVVNGNRHYDARNYRPIPGWVLTSAPQQQLFFDVNEDTNKFLGINGTGKDEITFYYKDVRVIEVPKDGKTPEGYVRVTFKADKGGSFGKDAEGKDITELNYDVIKGLKSDLLPVPEELGTKADGTPNDKVEGKYYITPETGKKFIKWDEKPLLNKNTIVDNDTKDFYVFTAKFEWSGLSASGLVRTEAFNDPNNKWTNDFAPKIEDLKKQLVWREKGEEKPLPTGAVIKLYDEAGTELTKDEQVYDLVNEKNKADNDELVRTVNIKAKVTFTDGKDPQELDIPIKVYKNVYEALTTGKKPLFLSEAEKKEAKDGGLKDITGEYVKVTVAPTGDMNSKDNKVYYVNKNAWVEIPNDSKGEASLINWTADKVGQNDDGKANGKFDFAKRHKFTEDTVISPRFSQTSELIAHESYKDGDTWVNDFITSELTEANLKAAIQVKNGNDTALGTDDKVTIVDDAGQPYANADALKTALYEKLKEKDDDGKVSRIENIKVKVTFANGEVQTLTIPVKVIKNIYQAKTKTGKPDYVPKNYVKVTLDPTTKAKDPQKYFYYVNPAAKVLIPGKDPVGVKEDFTGWTMKADSATGDGASYNLKDRHQFAEDSTIIAQYGQGKAKIKYVDENKNEIDSKYHIDGVDYPTEKIGKIGDNIPDPTTAEAPKFKGYIISSVSLDKKPAQYADPASAIITYQYNKKVTTDDKSQSKVHFPVVFDANTGAFTGGEEKVTVYVYFDGSEKTPEPVTFEEVRQAVEEQYGKPSKTNENFIEWQDKDKNGTKVEENYTITFKDWNNGETFYANYGNASALVKYLDLNGMPIADEFKISTEKYPTEKAGTKDEAIESNVFTATTAPKFIGYKFNRIELNPENSKYTLDKKATIKIYYEKLDDIIQDKTPNDATDKPEEYVTVTFKPGDNGTLDGKTDNVVYYVNPKATKTNADLKEPTIKANTGYKIADTKWNPSFQASTTITTDATYTAQYTASQDIIPSTGNDKPKGYVTVRFLTNKNGKLTGETTYYVNPKAKKIMGHITAPNITANDGYKVGSPKWKPDLAADTAVITEDKIFVANYDSLGKAEITYISMDTKMGTVRPASEELKDGKDVVGSTATANKDYRFVKWIDTKGNTVSEEAKFVPSVKQSATFIAVFENGTIADKVRKSYDLEGIDLAVFVGDGLNNAFWKGGVSKQLKQSNNLTEDEKAELKKALEEATVSDKSERNTKHKVLSPTKGMLEIKFTDGSTLSVEQKLYVYDNGSQKQEYQNQPTPKDKVEVTYKAGDGVENFTDKVVMVKKGTLEKDLPGRPDAKAKDGYKALKWTANPPIDITNGIQAETTLKASAVVDHDFAKTSFTVKKVWADDVNPVPTMNFTLYRKVEGGQEEAVKGVDVKEITKTITEATWENLAKTDTTGKAYTYFVKETFKDESSDVRNANWILGKMETENGTNIITNKLKTVPADGVTLNEKEHRMGELTITKMIESKVIKPQMQMRTPKAPAASLEFTFKVTDPYGKEETFTLKANETKVLENLLYGDYTVEETDAKGLTPFVKVGNGDETKSSTAKVTLTTTDKEGTVTFTNKNVKPQENPNIIEVTASKVWVNGPSKDHTAVYLKLYRQADGGQVEEVTDVTPVKSRDANDVNKFNYVWKDLPNINDEGKEYIYTVEEANVTDNKVTVNGNTYTVSKEGNTITNTYVVPQTEDLIATKQWVGVPDGTATPEVKFQLQRTANGVIEDVGQAMDLTNNQANFGKQDKTDKDGNVYTFSVKEVNADGSAFNHQNYTSEVNGLTVTNTYHAPEVKYTVTYLPGSSTATGTMNPVTVAENINYTVLANGFTNSGYTFKGWKVGDTTQIIQPGATINVTDDVTLTAQWEKITTPPTPGDQDNPDKPNPGYPGGPGYPSYPDRPYIPMYPEVRYETIIKEKIVKVPVPVTDGYFKEVRYMQGFEGKFRPFDGLTRAEAAQILANALKEDGYKYDPNYKISYKDIGNAWYTEAVKIVTQANVFKGYDDGNFKPQEKITRAEWIGTLKRFQELRDLSGNHMNLREGHWAMAEIEAAYQAGWLAIYSDGLADFKADEFIPRQEVAAVSNKAFERVLDKTYIKRNDKALVNYKDINDKMWSYEDILCASNTFLHDKKLYRAHGIDMSNEIFNINLDGFTITKDKFQRIER